MIHPRKETRTLLSQRRPGTCFRKGMREGLPVELTSKPEKKEQGSLTQVKAAGPGERSRGLVWVS